MALHPFILLAYGGAQVEIDIEIASLIQRLWAHGIKTDFSCQGDEFCEAARPAYIVFSTREDFDKLIKLVDGGFLRLSHIIDHMIMPTHALGLSIYFNNSEIPRFYSLIKEIRE